MTGSRRSLTLLFGKVGWRRPANDLTETVASDSAAHRLPYGTYGTLVRPRKHHPCDERARIPVADVTRVSNAEGKPMIVSQWLLWRSWRSSPASVSSSKRRSVPTCE